MASRAIGSCDSADPAPRGAAQGAATAVEVSWGQRLHLDKTGDSEFFVTDVLTHECHMLPAGDWEMVKFEETDDVSFVNIKGELIHPEDIMKNMLFINENTGEMYIQHVDSGQKGKVLSLADQAMKHKVAQVELQLGAAAAFVTMCPPELHPWMCCDWRM